MATSNAPASKSGLYADPREDWLAQRKEEVLDSGRPIVDPHHHLWDRGGQRYMIEEMAADIASGHNIVATVYVDCPSMYRPHGPEAGGPIGRGRFANRREETFSEWKGSIQEIAKCPNVVVKLGGLAMCLLGYDFHERPMPPSSEEAAAAWRPYIEACIEAFGPGRCMFESNFPPDKGQCSYQVIFNAFKRIAAQYSEAEKTALFSKTATDFYRLKLE